MSGLLPLLRLDARVLAGRPLFRTVLGAGVCAAVATALSSAHPGSGAWWRVAQALRVLVPIELAFGAVLGGVSIAGDAAAGALRGVLMRPVSRAGIIASRAITLSTGLALSFIIAALAACAAAAVVDSFGAITYGEGDAITELVTRAEMARAVPRLVLLALPLVICAPLIGLAVSTVFDDAAAAAVLALLVVLSPFLAETFAAGVPGWAFTHPAVEATAVLGQLSEGILTRLDGVQATSFTATAVAIPLGWGLAAAILASAVFRRRDFHA